MLENLSSPGASLEAIRARRPLVQNITNPVAMDLVANLLLAVGASPVMAEGAEEVEDFVSLADALTINIGGFTGARLSAASLAASKANALGKPWALDPVAVGATHFRRHAASHLLAFRPSVLRGNASEILALGGAEPSGGQGTDSGDSAESAFPAARALSRTTPTVVVATGARDVATDGETVVRVGNGNALMTRVTAVGCALTALTGACLAVAPSPLAASVHALAILGVAGEIAARKATGPGSFRSALIDTLHALDREELDRAADIEVVGP